MSSSTRSLIFVLVAGMGFAAALRADEKKPYTGAACAADADAQFRDEVWAKTPKPKWFP